MAFGADFGGSKAERLRLRGFLLVRLVAIGTNRDIGIVNFQEGPPVRAVYVLRVNRAVAFSTTRGDPVTRNVRLSYGMVSVAVGADCCIPVSGGKRARVIAFQFLLRLLRMARLALFAVFQLKLPVVYGGILRVREFPYTGVTRRAILQTMNRGSQRPDIHGERQFLRIGESGAQARRRMAADTGGIAQFSRAGCSGRDAGRQDSYAYNTKLEEESRDCTD